MNELSEVQSADRRQLARPRDDRQPTPMPPLADTDELLSLWESLMQHRLTLLGIGLAAAALAALLVYSMPSTYRSTVSLLVEAGRPRILSIEDLRQGGDNREFFQSQVEVLQSREVATRTVRTLELWDDQQFDPRDRGAGLLSRLRSMVGLAPARREWTQDQLADFATERLVETR